MAVRKKRPCQSHRRCLTRPVRTVKEGFPNFKECVPGTHLADQTMQLDDGVLERYHAL